MLALVTDSLHAPHGPFGTHVRDGRLSPDAGPATPTDDVSAGHEERAMDAISPATTQVRRVLVVEDEAPLRMIIRRNLERRDIAVKEASDAEEAIAAVRDDMPDLMLLDINLPDRTGWDVLRDLRADGRLPRTVVVSAVQVSPDLLREFHVEAYLPKPFPIESLVGLVAGAATTVPASPPASAIPLHALRATFSFVAASRDPAGATMVIVDVGEPGEEQELHRRVKELGDEFDLEQRVEVHGGEAIVHVWREGAR
jgi:CheY-like chemotaxis protein